MLAMGHFAQEQINNITNHFDDFQENSFHSSLLEAPKEKLDTCKLHFMLMIMVKSLLGQV